MAVSMICGFDMGDTNEAAQRSGNVSMSTKTRSGRGFSLRCQSLGNGLLQHRVFMRQRDAGNTSGTFRPFYNSVAFWYMHVMGDGYRMLEFLGGYLYQSTNGELYVTNAVNQTSTSAVIDSTTPPNTIIPGTWHRIVVTAVDSTRTDVYVDGNLVAFRNSGVTGASDQATVGLRAELDFVADTYFDEVVYYDAPMTAAEIAFDHRVSLLKPRADLAIGDWTRNDGTVTELWRSVNSSPPRGSASNTADPTNRIKNLVSSTTSNYDAECERYESLPDIFFEGSHGPEDVFATDFGHTAQSFIATDASVKTVSFVIAKAGAPTFATSVQIRADSAGTPGAVLGTSVLRTADTLVAGEEFWTFTTPVTVNPKARYWVNFTRTAAATSANNVQLLSIASARNVDSALFLSSDQGASFTSSAGSLRQMRVRSNTPPTVHSAIVVTNDAQGVTTGSPKQGAIGIPTNPASGTEQQFDYGIPNDTGSVTAANIGTFPVGWGTHWNRVADASAVSLTTSPTARAGKRVAQAREVAHDFLGVYVLWAPGIKFLTSSDSAAAVDNEMRFIVEQKASSDATTSVEDASVFIVVPATQQTLPPDTILSQVNATGVLANIREDPSSTDGQFIVQSGGALDLRVGFPTPGGDPVNEQYFRLRLRPGQ